MVRLGKRLAVALAAMAGIGAPPASAQIFFFPPEHEGPAVTGGEPGLFVPPMPNATPADHRANLLWNLRSSLNVAALNCQFWPYLNAVDNYNSLLRHHDEELAAAYEGLKDYFRRTQGRSWQSAMDTYTTAMYQSYIRIGSQRSFCHAAAETVREALGRPKGQLHLTAQGRMRQVRNSLVSYSDNTLPFNDPVPIPPLPRLDDSCWRGTSYNTRRC